MVVFKAVLKEVSQFQALARPFLPMQRLLSKVEQHIHGPSTFKFAFLAKARR